MELLFWLAVGLILYTYFIYPILLFVFSGLNQALSDTRYLWRRHQRRSIRLEELPAVSVVIAAYNEESCIEQRILNLLALDYPKDKLTIYVGSDGSSDRTADILRSLEISALNAQIFEVNRGKMSVLNDLMALVEDDIVILSDANTHFEKDAVSNLVRHFESPDVGAVCGELHLVDPASGENKDSIYWRYEQVLKFHESRLGALLGANGAIYAIRKSLFQPLPANTIVDDYQIVMNVARQNYRTLYDPEAVAIEEVAPDLSSEEGRRVRIGLGNYQALFSMHWALNPLLGWRFFTYISHKVCRWFVPHLMIVALLVNMVLITDPLYLVLFLTQVAFYILAFRGIRANKENKPVATPIALMSFFVSMNFALLCGFYRYFGSNVQGSWQRTTR
ncbi:glycosyltransferase family 2 protein [Motiliproteus sp. MSK22-1]|uniref:glycosyltransferase family 2 protein n=1 Tax=Motiliproteus sp. MSK22-1 TaxID=1897630 RepID=UPI00097563CC|nr:glycosyltransferase family 2 protein [Motiliproteus sp. MSK22-1]OMH25678.1 glycosyl transferase family 2 [Motiliproteus sp. MSK22-1]